MPAPRVSEVTVVVAAAVLIVVVAAVGAVLSPPPSERDERGSSFEPGPEGAKAAYLVLKQLGFQVERSIEPVASLSIDPRTSVLVLASPSVEPSDQDRRAVAHFVEQGGVVLASGPRGAAFFADHFEDGAEDEVPASYPPVVPSPLAAGAPAITMAREGGPVPIDPALLSIYGPEHGGVVRTKQMGEGRAIWWAGSTPLTNEAIADAHNFELLMSALGTRAVFWDEHYHGHVRSLWSYTAGTPLPWALAQIALVAAAALATYGRRRGPVRARVTDARTSPMEFVETLGGLYERARATSASVAAAHARLRRRLLSACGLPAASSTDAIARGAAARFGLDADEVAGLLAEAQQAGADDSLTPADGLGLVRRIQALAARVNR
jgi:Domain of unknown function (DUF4350)